MKINKISSKLIKPHTPTPQNLKNYHISFLDKIQRPMNLAIVMFYQSKPKDDSQLEESLSKILVQFYPLAGRYIKNDLMVDCSDQGAEFVEAEAPDVDLIAEIETEQLNNLLLPDQYFRVDEAAEAPLLSIQATHFRCGGVTIAISVSHRVFDVSSLDTFIAAWSSASNPDKRVGVVPSFDLPSLLPCKDYDFGVTPKQSSNEGAGDIVGRRFLFNEAALTTLKSKIGPNKNGKAVSGVRNVCAVIAKALMGLDGETHRPNRDFHIFQPINLREWTVPPQPKHACGNLSFTSLTRRVPASEAAVIGIQELVALMGDAIRDSIGRHAEILSPDRDGLEIITNTRKKAIKAFLDPDTKVIVFTDWSKFGFYETDFGWGKPVWASIGPRWGANTTLLLSNKEGDGIEAWLFLNQKDMHYFDQNQEIKSLTTFV